MGGHCSHLKVQHSHTAIVMIPRPYAAILNRLLNNILSFQIRRLAKVMCFVDGDLVNESVDHENVLCLNFKVDADKYPKYIDCSI